MNKKANRLILSAVILFSGFCSLIYAGRTQNSAPDSVVRNLYKTHDKDDGAILDGKSRTLLDKYFDKTLADFIWKDLTTHKDEVGVLDFDPFYNAQDTQIKNFGSEQKVMLFEK